MNNELLFKAPAVLYPFLSLLFLRALRREAEIPDPPDSLSRFSALPNLQYIMEKAGTFSTGRASCGNIGNGRRHALTARTLSSAASS